MDVFVVSVLLLYLPRSELREVAFAAIIQFTRFESIDSSEVRHSRHNAYKSGIPPQS